MPSTTADVEFMIEQARKCLRLAEARVDKELARSLLDLGWMFAQRAIECGADPSRIPAKALLRPVPNISPVERGIAGRSVNGR